MKFRILLGLILLSTVAHAQRDGSFDWWNTIHDWDEVSSWSDYIKMQPGYMGPNALPVPEMKNGTIDSNLTILLAAETHLAPNDFTANAYLEINVPIKNAVAVKLWWVPFEYFQTDTVVRDYRAGRTKSGQGTAVGSLYLGTVIPIVRNHTTWPDIALGINLKTASGNQLEDARFTDTPGYFFDLSFGKTFQFKNNFSIRPVATGGFFVYQTNRDDYFQNDAILWGAGAEMKKNTWQLNMQLTGYKGYFQDLDQPVVFRAEVGKTIGQFTTIFRCQGGNKSYPFTSLRLGVVYRGK